MTRTPDSAASEAMADRYGRPSIARRRAGIAAIAVLVAVLLGWLAWAALSHSRQTVGGLVESFEVRSPHEVAVTVQITRASTEAVQCTVAAIASDHATVGQQVVRLPRGSSGTSRVTTVVRTEREATTADVLGCH